LAVQHISPKQTFKRVNSAGFQTDLSLRGARTHMSRDKPDLCSYSFCWRSIHSHLQHRNWRLPTHIIEAVICDAMRTYCSEDIAVLAFGLFSWANQSTDDTK
jgi:hypothetical protein